MGKRKDKIRVLFCGENASDVTGSQVYIETPNKKILLECGMYQSVGSTLESWKINTKKFSFKAKDLDLVFVNHLHVDHTGLIPLLFNRGYSGRIISPTKTKRIAEILMFDSCHIIDSDAKLLSSQYGRQYEPFYTDDDVRSAINSWDEYEPNEIHQIDEFVKFRFVPSGHIIGACQLELWITENNVTKKILYTSDLGNVHIKKPYVEDFQLVDKCDLAICESTYAHEEKIANVKMRTQDLEKLECVIRQTCIEDRARILIPSFALARTQEIMTALYDLFVNTAFTIPIYIDSPMAIKINNVFSEILEGEDLERWQKVCSWQNFKYITDPMESKALRQTYSPCIVVASSGFMVAGRSVAWCGSILPHDKDRIVTIGFAPPGSMAYIIKQGEQKFLTVSGTKRANKCQITSLGSFTSHIQRDSMVNLYGKIDAQKICLVHGDMEGRLSIKPDIEKELSRNNLTTKVVVVQKDMEVCL